VTTNTSILTAVFPLTWLCWFRLGFLPVPVLEENLWGHVGSGTVFYGLDALSPNKQHHSIKRNSKL